MSQDTRLLALPHPQRVRGSPFLANAFNQEDWVAVFNRALWEQLMVWLEDTTLAPADIAARLIDAFPQFEPKFRSMDELNGTGTNYGSLATMIRTLRAYKLVLPQYQTTDFLEARLLQTDIGEGIPLKFFRAPLPEMYLEFGQHRVSPLRVNNIKTGDHVLEGVYLHERQYASGDRDLELEFIGSPLGRDDPLDDATQYITLKVSAEDEVSLTVGAWLEREFQRIAAVTLTYGMRELAPGHMTRELCLHVAKVLLYLNLKDARLEMCQEATLLAEQLKRLGPAKQAKLRRKLDKVYDRIIVGPPVNEASGNGSNGRAPTAHWRRGHFRNQAHGPGYALHKLIWLEPILVNSF